MVELTRDEELTRQSYDKNAAIWARTHMSPYFWKEEMKLFHNYLPDGRILEIGCGGGRDARELIEMGYDYLGTDVSKGLIGQAKIYNPTAEFLHSSVYDLNFDEIFDGFWCAAVLLHVPKRRINNALASIRRSVRPGAIGFIAIKEGYGEKVEHDKDSEGGSRLFSYWKDKDFRTVLKRSGYKIKKFIYKPLSERTKWLIYLVEVEK